MSVNLNILKINEIFKSIHGEGPYSGYPAIFIRMSGCNLSCKFCDTDFKNYVEMDVEKIINKVKEYTKLLHNIGNHGNFLVVITGGEPFKQNIKALCNALHKNNYKIQIESNGTIYSEIPDFVQVVCSPKLINGIYKNIHPQILPNTVAVKFLISETINGYHDIAEVGQSEFKIPVYIQPIDEKDNEKNKNNTKLAIELATKYNARLSLQIHKFMNIR